MKAPTSKIIISLLIISCLICFRAWSTLVKMLLMQSNISSGQVNIQGGILSATDCDFNNPTPQITLGTNGRGLLTGNRFKE